MSTLLIALAINRLWFCIPLIVSVSLVLAATRHEAKLPILRLALRTAGWIIGFIAVVFLVFYLVLKWI